MFTTSSHIRHNETWTVVSSPSKDSHQCLDCLVDILESISLSLVQRQVCLTVMKTAIEGNDDAVQLLRNRVSLSCHIISLVTDVYADEPHCETSVKLCVGMIHRVQHELVFNTLLDKFQSYILSKPKEKNLHLCLMILVELFDISYMYTEMFIFTHTSSLLQLLDTCKYMEECTVTSITCLLTHTVKTMLSSSAQSQDERDSFLWKVMEALVRWLHLGQSLDFQVNCLALLKECLMSKEMIEGLLMVGKEGQEAHTLLMGLKRVLVTKNESLVVSGLQCLVRLLGSLTDAEQIKQVFDTDLTEFVFEFLHTLNVLKQDCVFQCLQTMASHQLFFDKCHAIYGMDSTLLAIREAVNSRRTLIVERGLAFLTCVLTRQPVNMPLFVDQAWSRCCLLLTDCLCLNGDSLFPLSLRATEAFLRFQYQQSHIDVRQISSLLTSVLSQSKHHIMSARSHGRGEQTLELVNLLLDIMVTTHRLLIEETLLCGNELTAIQELGTVLRTLCGNLIIPCLSEYLMYVKEISTVEKFLRCVAIQCGSAGEDGTAEQIVASGLPCQILSLLSLPQFIYAQDVRQMGGHVLAGVLLQVSKNVKPSLQINKESLTVGLSRLCWQTTEPVQTTFDRISSKEEIAAWLCLLYCLYLQGFRVWPESECAKFLSQTLQGFPDLLTYDMIVPRAVVYLLAVSQRECLEESNDINGMDDVQFILHLENLAVDVWYTDDLVVFKWCLNMDQRNSNLGRMLVEYWLVHLDVQETKTGLRISDLNKKSQEILLEMRNNISFLHFLVNLLKSKLVAYPSKEVLMFCISSIPGDSSDSDSKVLFDRLFHETTLCFETLFVQVTEVDEILALNMLPLLSALHEHPLSCVVRKPSCFKSVHHALKLIGKDDAENERIICVLKYLASVTISLSAQSSIAVIPIMVQNERFMSSLQDSLKSPEMDLTLPAITITAWLAVYGQSCQVRRPVVVTSNLLMNHLTSTKSCLCLPMLKLLNAVLSIVCCGTPSGGAVKFIKQRHQFLSTNIFSTSELRQAYVYLQQLVVQGDTEIMKEAMKCIMKLFTGGSELVQHIGMQPWNSLMLEIFLASKTEAGLTDLELDFCSQFSDEFVVVWTSNAANSYLIALLNSSISSSQHDKAARLVEQIKCQGIFDLSLLATVDECLSDCSPTNI